MSSLMINRIYYAVEGEGVRIGTPQIFLRLQGCRIGCKNCDSRETWNFQGPKETIEAILARINKLSKGQRNFWVSITGGDPLDPAHRDGLVALCQRLKEEQYCINVEASGMRFVPEIFSLVDFISCDYKTPSTGVRGSLKSLEKLVLTYPEKYQIKSVISNEDDFKAVQKAYGQLREYIKRDIIWVLTPCFETGETPPRDKVDRLFQKVISSPHFRVIAQQHKFIYGSKRLDI